MLTFLAEQTESGQYEHPSLKDRNEASDDADYEQNAAHSQPKDP